MLFSMLVSSVYSADEYGNYLNSVQVYQKELGSWVLRDSTNSSEYSPLYNVTIKYGQSLIFYGHGFLNATEWDYGEIASTYGLGIQIYDDSIYQNPMQIQLPTYQTGGFWHCDFVSETLAFDISEEITVGNVTEWINYNNGSGWLLVEEWKFQLVCYDFPEPEEPIVSEGELNLSIFWFWLFVIFLFLTPLCAVGALKGGGAKYFLYAIISFAFCITFYSMLSVSVIG